MPKSRLLLSRRPVGIPPAAIEIEPQHAFSHAGLSRALVELGFSTDARTEAEKAFCLADNLPNEEKLLLEAQVSETRFDWDKPSEITEASSCFLHRMCHTGCNEETIERRAMATNVTREGSGYPLWTVNSTIGVGEHQQNSNSGRILPC